MASGAPFFHDVDQVVLANWLADAFCVLLDVAGIETTGHTLEHVHAEDFPLVCRAVTGTWILTAGHLRHRLYE
jgi:hypothetical protein